MGKENLKPVTKDVKGKRKVKFSENRLEKRKSERQLLKKKRYH